MYHVAQLAVTNASLTSNVSDVAPAAYASGTTYTSGNQVSVADGTMRTIYESLQNGNIGHPPASSPSWWKLVSVTYVAWDNSVSYSLNDVVIYNNRQYKSLSGSSNVNRQPGTTNGASFWVDIGPSNKWAMFDRLIDTQTERVDAVDTSIVAEQRFDTVALFGVQAASVNITVTNDGNELHNEDYSMVDYTGIANYWDHFFNPVRRRETLTVRDLPIVSGNVLNVTATDVGNTVRVGHLTYGRSNKFGKTLKGSDIGFINFSDMQDDAFGRRTIVPRAYRKEGGFNVWVLNPYVDRVYKDLIQYKDTPGLFIAIDRFEAAVYFGIVKSARIVLESAGNSNLAVKLEDF